MSSLKPESHHFEKKSAIHYDHGERDESGLLVGTIFTFQSANWKDVKVASDLRKKLSVSLKISASDRKHNAEFYKNDGCTLSPTDSGLWFNIIVHDDYFSYDSLMSALNDAEKQLLLSGSFWYDLYYTQPVVQRALDKSHNFHYPIILAAIYRANHCLERIFHDGADPIQSDQNGYNVVHSIIIAAAASPHLEKEYMKTYDTVMRNTNFKKRKQLLLAEDVKNFLPIELAAKLGLFGLFKYIMYSDGIYMKTMGRTGVHNHVLYDVGEYEDFRFPDRLFRSPLQYIARTTKASEKSLLDHRIMTLPVIKTWIKFKQRRTFPYVLLWAVLRIVYVLVILALDVLVDKINIIETLIGLPADSAQWFLRVTAAMSGVIMLFHLSEWTVNACYRRRKRAYKETFRYHQTSPYLAHTYFYRINNCILSLLVVIEYVFQLMSGSKIFENSMYHYTRPPIFCMSLLSLLEILEMVPYMSQFAVLLQKAVPMTMKFAFIHVLMKLIFAVHFYMMCHHRPDAPDFVCLPSEYSYNINTTGLQHQSFFTVKRGFYDIFRLDLNGISFGLDPPTYVVLTHMAFYYATTSLMYVFLIATMVNVVVDNGPIAKIIADLRILDKMLIVESRFGGLLKILEYQKKPYHILVTQPAVESKC
jgi:hypothetical protein